MTDLVRQIALFLAGLSIGVGLAQLVGWWRREEPGAREKRKRIVGFVLLILVVPAEVILRPRIGYLGTALVGLPTLAAALVLLHLGDPDRRRASNQ